MLTEVLIGLFILVLAAALVFLLREPVIFKMGLRNIMRRKGYALIIVFGLMVGTAVITASLSVGDTMDTMISSEILNQYHTTDEQLVAMTPTGERAYFNQSVFSRVEQQLDREHIDGLSPAIQDAVAALDMDTNLSEPRVTFYGVDMATAPPFGSLVTRNGTAITRLEPGDVLMAMDTADDLEASAGDQLVIYANNTPRFFTVTHILQKEARAGSDRGIYVSLQTAQSVLNRTGQINEILVSNTGGVHEGIRHTRAVEQAFKPVLRTLTSETGLSFELTDIKKDMLDESRQNMQQFTDLFLVFGSFSVIAGVILIINIFVMLAEERKPEMGMARAVGMQRGQLQRMYMAEGLVYALIASAVGVGFGIAVGYIIMWGMSAIFAEFGAFNMLQYFTATPVSLLLGFTVGFFITIATITVTARRISGLNIVRAVRDIPEPAIRLSDRRMLFIGMLLLVGAGLSVVVGVAGEQAALFFSGVSLLFIGAATVARRWMGDRTAYTAAGAATLVWWFLPWSWFPDYGGGIEMFIISGLFLVVGSLLIVMFNARTITGLFTAVFGWFRSMPAVLKTSISYSLWSRFRTGMTIAIFALIIFSITVMSMIVGMLGTNIERQVDEAAGGYDIMAFTLPALPISDIEAALASKGLDGEIDKTAAMYSTFLTINTTKAGGAGTTGYRLLGVGEDFARHNEFGFAELLPEYANETTAWDALLSNGSLAVIDGSVQANEFGPPSALTVELGGTISMKNRDNQTVEKKIIGILDTTIVQGVYISAGQARQEFGLQAPTFFLFSVSDGADTDTVAKDLERAFLTNGMQTVDVENMVLQFLEAMNQFFNLFEAFMALGLVIGIAGLGIITIRSVHERRQEIGMMRALGFKKRDVLASFTIETSFVAVLGIVIGTLLGIFISYTLWRDSFKPQGFDFMVNWQPVLLVAVIALAVTLLSIIPASWKASRVPPAEALRYKE
ncbi:MAG: FtsX-like permease family protein [Thermoplasmatota archaeon]